MGRFVGSACREICKERALSGPLPEKIHAVARGDMAGLRSLSESQDSGLLSSPGTSDLPYRCPRVCRLSSLQVRVVEHRIMPMVPLTLAVAKAEDNEIPAKPNWIEQSQKFASEVRRLELDLQEVSMGLESPLAEDESSTSEAQATESDSTWLQVSGARQLMGQLARRDSVSLRSAPDQALALQDILASVHAALSAHSASLVATEAALDKECLTQRVAVRRELGELLTGERASEDFSDEEDALLDRTGGILDYEADLQQLNDKARTEMAGLEQELAELRSRVAGSWDDQAHFRFLCVKGAFKGRSRELLADRLALEFPHLSRDQLQAHDAHCDFLRFVSQRQTAAFRRWRRDRQQLLRQHGVALEARLRCEEEQHERRESAAEHQERQRRCRERPEAERRAGSVRHSEERKALDAQRSEERDAEERREQQRCSCANSVRVTAVEHAARKSEQKRKAQLQAAAMCRPRSRRSQNRRGRRRRRPRSRRSQNRRRRRMMMRRSSEAHGEVHESMKGLVDLQLKQEQLSKHERPVLICADMKKKNQELKAQAEMSEGRKHKRASKGGGRLNLPGLREIRPGGLE